MIEEIERKFLPANEKWREAVEKVHDIWQGYMDLSKDTIKVVRVKEKGKNRYKLKIKTSSGTFSKNITDKEYKVLKKNLYIKRKVLRARKKDDTYILTIKIDKGVVGKKIEVEKFLSNEEFEMMRKYSTSYVSKNRHIVTYKGKVFEIDEFKEKNEGLILIEVELNSINETVELPDWVGKEVTEDPSYYNSELAKE